MCDCKCHVPPAISVRVDNAHITVSPLIAASTVWESVRGQVVGLRAVAARTFKGYR